MNVNAVTVPEEELVLKVVAGAIEYFDVLFKTSMFFQGDLVVAFA